MSKYLQFNIENAEVIEEPIDSQFATARIQAFSSDRNLHDLVCSEDILQQTAPSIYNKPILYTIDKSLQDFYTHVEPDKSLICGFVVPDSAEFIRQEDGRLSLSVLARIWKKYSPKVIELFSRDKNRKRVSVEMEVKELRDRPDGLVDMISFVYAGICILGDFVREASPGANMQMVSFSEEKKEYDQAYLEEFAFKYESLDFSIPKKVKENAQEGLDLHKKHKQGGTSVSLAVARHLISSEKANFEKVRHVNKHFNLHSSSDLSNKTGKEFIKWQMYGGNEAANWSAKLVESMDKVDARKVAYFAEGEDMPKKLKEEKMSDEEKLAEEVTMAEEKKKLEMATQVEVDEKKKAEEAKFAEDEAKKKVEEEEANKKEEMAAEEKPFSFAEFSNLIAYMDEEVGDDESAKMCKLAAEELKKPDGANFGAVAMGMYSKMCKMSEKMTAMTEEMSVLKEFKASIEAQQKQFAVDQTLRELEEKVVIPEDARSAMVADAEKYSFAEINVWQNNCKAKSFDFAVKSTKESSEKKVKKYAFPFNSSPTPKTLWTLPK